MSRQETISPAVLPSMTAAQDQPTPHPSTWRSSQTISPMRSSCSTIWLSTEGATRRRARKYPRKAAATAINGRLGANSRSDSSARASPSRYRAAGYAPKNCNAPAAAPSSAPVRATRPNAPAARPGCSPASSSATRRVAATEMPAVAKVTARL